MNTTTTSLDGIRSDMRCFALPYGSIGFVLDLLVVYGICFIIGGQSPWKGEEIEHQPMNMYFSSIGMFGGFGVAVYNAMRCNDHWPLALVSVWKGAYVGLFNFINLTNNWDSHMKKTRSDKAAFAIGFYTLSSIVGAVGLHRIAQEGWEDSSMKIVCSIIIVAFVVSTIGMRLLVRRETPGDAVGEWLAGVILCICLIGDMGLNLVLAAAAHQVSSIPVGRDTGFIATYAVYTITMLLPLTTA